MPGDFGELTVNIGLGINFLAGGTFYFNSNNTLSYQENFDSFFAIAEELQLKGLKGSDDQN